MVIRHGNRKLRIRLTCWFGEIRLPKEITCNAQDSRAVRTHNPPKPLLESVARKSNSHLFLKHSACGVSEFE